MAAPTRIGNLSFTYNRSTNDFRRQEEENEFRNNLLSDISKNVEALSTSSKTFNTSQPKTDENEVRKKGNHDVNKPITESSNHVDAVDSGLLTIETDEAYRPRHSSFSNTSHTLLVNNPKQRSASFTTHRDTPSQRSNLQRSDSKRLIDDNNNLKNLFALARSNINDGEHNGEQPTRKKNDEVKPQGFEMKHIKDDHLKKPGPSILRSSSSVGKYENKNQQNTIENRTYSRVDSRSPTYMKLNDIEPKETLVSRGRSVSLSSSIDNERNVSRNRFRQKVKRSDSLLSFDADEDDENTIIPVDIVPQNTRPEITEQKKINFFSKKRYFGENNKRSENIAENKVEHDASRGRSHSGGNALKEVGGILLSSDKDYETLKISRETSETKNKDELNESFLPVTVRQRSKSIEDLVSTLHESKHHEMNKQTSSINYNPKYSSMNMNYAEGDEGTIFHNQSTYLTSHKNRTTRESNTSEEKLKSTFSRLSVEKEVSPVKVCHLRTKDIHNTSLGGQKPRQKKVTHTATTDSKRRDFANVKKRTLKNNIHNKRAFMDYGEFDQAFMNHAGSDKDTNSEGKASSVDEGYETSHTNASDLNSSTNSDWSHKPALQGLCLNNEQYLESRDSLSSNTKAKSLSNLHEILNFESEKERMEKETWEKEREDLKQGRKDVHKKLDNMLRARAKTMGASDRAFIKRQMHNPDPLLVNEPPLIIDREPSLDLADSIERMANIQPKYRTSYDSLNIKPTNSAPPEQRKIDASYSKPNYGTGIARASSFNVLNDGRNSLFYLKEKDCSELNKKENMLNELRTAMIKRSRSASPTEDNGLDATDVGNGKIDKRSYPDASTKNISHSDVFKQGEEMEVDLYSSFPLPFKQNLTKHEVKESLDGDSGILRDRQSTDENPINKNAVMHMLKNHFKVKTDLSSNEVKKDLNFSTPKMTGKSFTLASKDIDIEDASMKTTESTIAQEENTSLQAIPKIHISQHKSPQRRLKKDVIETKTYGEADDPKKTVQEKTTNAPDEIDRETAYDEEIGTTSKNKPTMLNNDDDVSKTQSANQTATSHGVNRRSSMLNSAIKYAQTKKPPVCSTSIEAVFSSNKDGIESYQCREREYILKQVAVVSPDSRGLNLHTTEYYNPEENDEKVIKPSEFKVHRFTEKTKMIMENAVKKPAEVEHAHLKMQKISDLDATDVVKKPINIEHTHSKTQNIPDLDGKLSLAELKRLRVQKRFENSRKLSSSEPLLDKIGDTDSRARSGTISQNHFQPNSIVRTMEHTGRRSKKVEKWSNEIYVNVNVGKINIPDSFQEKRDANNNNNNNDNNNLYGQATKEVEGNVKARKHKHDQSESSNSSTPRGSMPKKSRRRFSLSSIGSSGNTTPRSDVTGTTVLSSPGSSARPSSPSLGSRIKSMFSPKSKRKSKVPRDEEMVEDDILRRLNMNVHNSNNFSSSFGFNGPITNGHSSVRSQSGLSINTEDDADFGVDDNFLSTEEWLNSQQLATNTRKPSIKRSLVPVNSRQNQDQIESWRVRKNVGKVTVPEVFSNANTGLSDEYTDNTKLQNTKSPVLVRKPKSSRHINGFRMNSNDVVFTSFDVNQ